MRKKFYFSIIAFMVTLAVGAQTREYVDLGLPSGTLWATCNVGANAPEEYGDYFAWGETEPKESYASSTYKWYESVQANTELYSKYVVHTDVSGFMDNKNVLDSEDDAAIVNWGNEWCTPSFDQINELINTKYTTHKWTTQNGVEGFLLTSKKNNNSIFMPASGYKLGKELAQDGAIGCYWSKAVVADAPDRAYLIYFTAGGNFEQYNKPRSRGYSVRPVRANVSTSIVEINDNQEATKSGKYISGGNLVIVKDGKKYNANGIEIK